MFTVAGPFVALLTVIVLTVMPAELGKLRLNRFVHPPAPTSPATNVVLSVSALAPVAEIPKANRVAAPIRANRIVPSFPLSDVLVPPANVCHAPHRPRSKLMTTRDP